MGIEQCAQWERIFESGVSGVSGAGGRTARRAMRLQHRGKAVETREDPRNWCVVPIGRGMWVDQRK